MSQSSDDWDAAEEAREEAALARIEAALPGSWVDVHMCCDLCGERFAVGPGGMGPKAMSNVEALEAYADELEAGRAASKPGA